MSNRVEGFIEKIFTKEGKGGKGPWALDNLLLVDEDNNEIGWFGLGFRDKADVPPKCKEGDFIVADWEQDGQYKNIVKGSARIRNPEKAPQRAAAATSTTAASGSGNADRQQSITYQSSRKDAIELVGTLLENDALPITGAKTKAGQAKRYDEIVAAVNKLTVQLYNDVTSFRLFQTVTDAGTVDASADGAVPDQEPEPAATEDGDEPV